MHKRFFFLTLAALSFAPLCAQDEPLWMRSCAISPEGNAVAFSYMGDIYRVDVGGGKALQLTSNPSHDTSPVWSPDGRQIAFASDREGGMDVYVMPSGGGEYRRLTTHSSAEYPMAWLDASTVVLRRAGNPTVNNLAFPSGTFYQLYSVSEQGGRQKLFSELTLDDLSIASNGKLLYIDVKGYEDKWRKHHTSSITRDVWMMADGTYTRLTDFKGEDRNPVWAPDGKSFYYLSEKDGTLNVYRRNLQSRSDEQITRFVGNPVRYLSVASNGTLCYAYDGSIYTQHPGGEPQKLSVSIQNDSQPRNLIRTLTSRGARSVVVSPQGKEVAFILNDDVYVTDMEYNTTKQITDTPERERKVDFRNDGRALVYDSERNGVWSIFQTELVLKEENRFAYSTELKEERLTDGVTTSFQPLYSPDGKLVAYLENRTAIRVMNLKSGKSHIVMDGKYAYSYSDGDQYFTWSPDSKWLLADYIGTAGWCIGDVALLQADGKAAPVNLTQSGYSDGHPRWVMDGRAMIFASDRAGYRSHGSWGAEQDVYIMFFDPEAYEEFRMNKEELALWRAERDNKKKEAKKDSAENATKELTFELSNLDARTIRLTMGSTRLSDAVMNREGTKLYYLAPFNGNMALWIRDIKEGRNEMKLPSISAGGLSIDAACKTCYFSGAGGSIQKLDLASAQVKTIPFETFTNTRPAQTMSYYFEHMWRQTKEKLYDPGMNGADWDRLYTTYRRYLPHINNGYDFSEMASELLGELNVSHTGCRYRPVSGALATAELGLLFDPVHQGDGLRIAEVLQGGPLDVNPRIKSGSVILAIDGTPIMADTDYFPLLAGKAGRAVRLSLKGEKDDVVIRAISSGAQNELLYKRWVKRNEEMVHRLSEGKLAYVHIKAMDAESFHELYKNLLSDSNRQREAVIVDTRHNGGGWLHNDVCTLLSGKCTSKYVPRGQHIGNDPYNRWVKPSCMLICEDNYSNAHGTPWLYKELGIGKLIGAPVAGTMTAVWWETIGAYTFGIPQVGTVDNRGQFLENQNLNPDIECYISPTDMLCGRDTQIEAAVKELLQK